MIFSQKILDWTHHLRQSGFLSIITLLLSELIVVLWLSFFALFALEMLLPTFVLARLSLAQYFFWLLLGTLATLKLRQETSIAYFDIPKKIWFPAIIFGWFFVLILTLLALVHFSLIGGAIFFSLYTGLSFLLWHWLTHESC